MTARVYLFPDADVRRGGKTPLTPGAQGGGGLGLHPSHSGLAATHLVAARAALQRFDLQVLMNGGVHHGRGYRAPAPVLSCGEARQISAGEA